MSKLPTAYQTLNNHLSRVGLTLATAHESILLDAIESHTAAHTAALREELNTSRQATDNVLEQLVSCIDENKLLKERIKELEAKIASYESAIDGLKKVVDSLYKLRS